MKTSSAWLFAIAIVGLAVGSASSHADPILWNYSSNTHMVLPFEVPGDPPGLVDILFFGRAAFDDQPVPAPLHGSADIEFVLIRAEWDPLLEKFHPNASVVFQDEPYSMNLRLHDLASGAQEKLSFSAQLDGEFSLDAVSLTNTFTGETTQSVVLGANRYTVTLTDFIPPGPPNTGELGSIRAHVEVAPAAAETPEPGTLLLAGLGLPLLGGLLYRRRQPQPA